MALMLDLFESSSLPYLLSNYDPLVLKDISKILISINKKRNELERKAMKGEKEEIDEQGNTREDWNKALDKHIPNTVDYDSIFKNAPTQKNR